MKIILSALLAGAAAQFLPLCTVGSGSCPTYSMCGYVPAYYAGPNNTAVCANITAVNSCVPSVDVVTQVVNFPIISAIVTAKVCDSNGVRVPIGGLSASNLVLQEDGSPIPAESASLIAIGDIPKLRTLILVDVSYSMTGSTATTLATYLNTVNTTINGLYSSLSTAAAPPYMRAHLLSIGIFSGGTTQTVCDYFSMSDSTAAAVLSRCLASLDILPADDSSNIYDTIVKAVASVDAANQADPEYNAAFPMYFSTVMLISDGIDSAQVATMNQAIQSNTVVAAFGTGAYLNGTIFQSYLQPSQNVPFFGTVGPYSTSTGAMTQYFGAKVMLRGMYQQTGQYFIRYCSPARGNANGAHTLTVSFRDPANGIYPLVGATSAAVSFTAVSGAGPCNDRYSRMSATIVPGQMSTANGGPLGYACALTGTQQVVNKFFCASALPSPSPIPSATRTSSFTPTPSTSRIPVPLTVLIPTELDGHSVGAGIGITLAIFIAAAITAICVIGTKAGIISWPCIRRTWTHPQPTPSRASNTATGTADWGRPVVSANPMAQM